MVTQQEWLKKELESYLNEEQVERIIKEYNEEYNEEYDLFLETKIKKLLEVDISNELPSDWEKQLVKISEETESRKKIDFLTKELEELRIEQSQVNEMSGELFSLNKEIEEAKKLKKNLEREVSEKEEQIKNFSSESDKYRELDKELARLKKELEDAKSRIADLRVKNNELKVKVESLKKESRNNCLKLQEKIEEEKIALEAVKSELLKNEKFKTFAEKRLSGADNTEKIERILALQKVISKGNDDDNVFAKQKEDLVGAVPEEIRNKLENLFEAKKNLTKLEINLENAKKRTKVLVNYGVMIEGNNNKLQDIMVQDISAKVEVKTVN